MRSSSEQGDGQVSLTGQSDSFFYSLVVLFPYLVVVRWFAYIFAFSCDTFVETFFCVKFIRQI